MLTLPSFHHGIVSIGSLSDQEYHGDRQVNQVYEEDEMSGDLYCIVEEALNKDH